VKLKQQSTHTHTYTHTHIRTGPEKEIAGKLLGKVMDIGVNK